MYRHHHLCCSTIIYCQFDIKTNVNTESMYLSTIIPGLLHIPYFLWYLVLLPVVHNILLVFVIIGVIMFDLTPTSTLTKMTFPMSNWTLTKMTFLMPNTTLTQMKFLMPNSTLTQMTSSMPNSTQLRWPSRCLIQLYSDDLLDA